MSNQVYKSQKISPNRVRNVIFALRSLGIAPVVTSNGVEIKPIDTPDLSVIAGLWGENAFNLFSVLCANKFGFWPDRAATDKAIQILASQEE